jgi:importin subunit alpha-6/7
VWALGNIAGDSPGCRDLVLGYQAMGPLLQQLHSNSKLSMLRNATWTLSNFCRGKPQPDFEVVRVALPTLAAVSLMTHHHSLVAKVMYCWEPFRKDVCCPGVGMSSPYDFLML